MKTTVQIDSESYDVDIGNPISLAIPLHFNSAQPNPHGVAMATSSPIEIPGMIGDTRQKGCVNWEKLVFTPHSNGTHTECVGHITDNRITIHKSFSEVFFPTVLISVTPIPSEETRDRYHPEKKPSDKMITRSSLIDALKGYPDVFCKGVVIRTLPNDEGKQERHYLKEPPPFFSLEAMQYLVEKGVKHLLVDLPSVDSASDDGKLAAHRLFWNVPLNSRSLTESSHPNRTITEMVYVSNSVQDGTYLLTIQIPSFMSDAAP
ncbi:MAG: hypothetical protein K1060chlam2_01563, partial [Chlamydiae bacterium]|nr:hypothetical protein [Chlamydiota bacterium]